MLAPAFLRDALGASVLAAAPGPYGELVGPDSNGLMLPSGFSSRRIGQAGQTVGPSRYVLPPAPDGQATFKTFDGGWILVTNSESGAPTGGTSAIRFAADGTIKDAYRILGGTQTNCAGGPTPWGAWLSGEEHVGGLIWECDPAGKIAATSRPAMGMFKHEAAAVDRVGKRVYLSEDNDPGGFYRFTPNSYPDLSAGTLEVAQRHGDGSVVWHTVADPTTIQTGVPTNAQVPQMTPFRGGEGLWYANGVIYFTTKLDIKVWAYTIATQNMEIIYDHTLSPAESLNAVDNVTVSAAGDVLVCEDGGNLEVGLIAPDRTVSPLLRFVTPEHDGSELCGVVFDPSQKRLYVTSQRAFGQGAIYEISGPFRIPAGGIPGTCSTAHRSASQRGRRRRRRRRRHRPRRRCRRCATRGSPARRSRSAGAWRARACSRAGSRSASPSTRPRRSRSSSTARRSGRARTAATRQRAPTVSCSAA